MEQHRFGVVFLNPFELPHTVEALDQFGMIRSQEIFQNRQRTAGGRLGLGVSTLAAEHGGQVVKHCRDVRSRGTEGLFPDREGSTKQPFSLVQLLVGMQHECQVVETGRDIRVVRAKRLFPDGHRPPIKRFGIGVVAFGPVRFSQIVQGCRNVGVIGSQNGFPDRQRPAIERHGPCTVTTDPANLCQVVQARGEAQIFGPELFGALEGGFETFGRLLVSLFANMLQTGIPFTHPCFFGQCDYLENGVFGAEPEDRTDLSTVEAADSGLKLLAQVRDGEFSKISTCPRGWIERNFTREGIERAS